MPTISDTSFIDDFTWHGFSTESRYLRSLNSWVLDLLPCRIIWIKHSCQTSLQGPLHAPSFFIMDFAKFECSSTLDVCFQTLSVYREQHGIVLPIHGMPMTWSNPLHLQRVCLVAPTKRFCRSSHIRWWTRMIQSTQIQPVRSMSTHKILCHWPRL